MLLVRMKSLAQRPFTTRSQHPDKSRVQQLGMTIIEILIVIALMGTILTLIATNILDVGESARRDAARIAMQKIQSSLDMYRIHNYRYPSTEQGLQALVNKPQEGNRWRGPYIDNNQLEDPWGNQYQYESDGRAFRIISPGPDATFGTPDDVLFPDDAGAEGEE
ncbi:MAG: type II secretion system major pseudopilin GspG [Oligoflexus sp.]